MSKIALLTSDKPLSRTVAHALQQRFGDIAIIAVPRRSPFASVGHRVRRLGVTKATGQLLLLGAYGPLASLLAAPRRRSILAEHRLNSAPLPPSRVHRVPSVNADETVSLLQRLEPDVVVVFHTPIISDRVIKSIRAPFINLHGGITPAYRGNYGAYWALVNREYEHCGVTIHLVDKGIDTGDMISQLRTRPTSHDSFFTYQFFQTAKGMPLLLQAVEDALNGSLCTYRRDAEPSRCWTTPTLFEYLRNGWRSGVW